MEVVTNQWNKEAGNEDEEVGFQRKRLLQHSGSSSSSSDNDIEGDNSPGTKDFMEGGLNGGGQEFYESVAKETFDFKAENLAIQMNAEINLQNGDIGNSEILPVSDPPIPEGSTLVNMTTEIGRRIGIMEENELRSQELILESVFQKPPTHGFYCPNCKTCIQKVIIQKVIVPVPVPVPAQPLQPTETIRCSSCFSFLIPIGIWLGLVSDQDGSLNYQVTGSSNNNTGGQQGQKPEGASSQSKAPAPDQFGKLSQPEAQNTSKLVVDIPNYSGKPVLQAEEEVIINGAHKVPNEVADNINGTGLGIILENNVKVPDSSNHLNSEMSENQQNGEVATTKKPFGSDLPLIAIGDAYESFMPKKPQFIGSTKNSDWGIIATASETTEPKQPGTDILDKPNKEEPQHVIQVDGTHIGPAAEPAASTGSTPLLREPPPVVQEIEPESSKRWEILKSIVYGGLTESLASLSVVTSAASADATTLNIVALAIANLVGGLFVLGHNLRELKAEQPKRSNNQTGTPVDRYNELLGHKDNFILHAFVAILSFIIFGLVPPLVYGFSFKESDNKDFKLAAVAIASILCITLLSIAKAHIQRPNSYVTYFTTVLYYVTAGAVASVLSYVAGDLVKKLVEKLGWFDESASNFAIKVNGINIEKPQWASY